MLCAILWDRTLARALRVLLLSGTLVRELGEINIGTTFTITARIAFSVARFCVRSIRDPVRFISHVEATPPRDTHGDAWIRRRDEFKWERPHGINLYRYWFGEVVHEGGYREARGSALRNAFQGRT